MTEDSPRLWDTDRASVMVYEMGTTSFELCLYRFESGPYGFCFHSENEAPPISRSTIGFGLPERTVLWSTVMF